MISPVPIQFSRFVRERKNNSSNSFVRAVVPGNLITNGLKFVAAGVKLVGGCCGTTPEHIRVMKSGLRASHARAKISDPQVNANSLGAKNLKRADGTAIKSGDIIASQVLDCVYSTSLGTMLTFGSRALSAATSELASTSNQATAFISAGQNAVHRPPDTRRCVGRGDGWLRWPEPSG